MGKSVKSKQEKTYALQQIEHDPIHVLTFEPILIYDIATVINFAYQVNIEPTKSGNMPKRLSKKLAPLLNVNQLGNGAAEEYIDTVFALLTHERILSLKQDAFNEEKIHVIMGPRLAEWQSLTMLQQVQDLLDYWQEREFSANAGSLNGDNFFYSFQGGYYGYASYDQQWSRQMLLQELGKSQANTWYSLESLFEMIWQQEQQVQQNASSFYPRRRFLDFADWLHYSAARYLAMLTGVIRDLGLLELGYDEALADDKIPIQQCYYRLTALAQAVLHAEEDSATPEQQIQGNYIIQPNFDIMLLAPDMPALYQLLPFTQVKRINQASTLQLNKASLQKGLEAGLHMEQIEQILTQRSGASIAQNVLYTLREWADQHKVLQVSLSYIIEAPDEITVARMLNNATFKKLTARQLTPCIFQLSASTNIQTLKTALDKEGIQLKYHDL